MEIQNPVTVERVRDPESGFMTLISQITLSSEKKGGGEGGFSLKKTGMGALDNHRAQGRHSENTFCFVENPSLEFLVSPQLRNLSQPEPEDCSES